MYKVLRRAWSRELAPGDSSGLYEGAGVVTVSVSRSAGVRTAERARAHTDQRSIWSTARG